MNKARRKALKVILESVQDLRDQLELLHDEEEEYRESIPENLQSSEKYEKADAAVYALSEAVESLENAAAEIESAME